MPLATDPDWLPRAIQLREQKWSYRRIGEAVGAHPGTVHYYLNTGRHGRRDCNECGAEFEPRAPTARHCSPQCAAAASHRRAAVSGRASAAKRGRRNPVYRHGRRAGVRDRRGERRFVDPAGSCRNPACPNTGIWLNQHHVVYRQALRGQDVWDPDNALAMCHSCHSSHHNRGRVLPLVALRDENFAFAARVLGHGPAYEYLRRRYSGEDPRLDALLT